MDGADRCPPDETLDLFCEGRLSAEERERLVAHCGQCADCAALVAALTRAAPPAESASRAEPSLADTVADESLGLSRTAELAEPRAPLVLAPGDARSFGRYQLTGVLGAGAMGVVYVAWDPDLGREVALKVLRADADGHEDGQHERLLREAQAVARVAHPNVITVYDVGVLEGRVYFTMERIVGQTLREWLRVPDGGGARQSRRRPWPEVLRALVAAGEGLAAAHAAGLVHRDFKPDNVLVANDGRVLVTDFGLARSLYANRPHALDGPQDLSRTRTGMLVGTPYYMAPEQYEGAAVDARADIFAFCVAAWEALFGQRPFEGHDLPSLREAIREGVVARPDVRARVRVPPHLSAVLSKGMRRWPAERYQSLAPLLSRLRLTVPSRTRRLVAGAGLLAALVAATGVFAAIQTWADPVCGGAAASWATVWRPAVREALGARFAATGKAFAPAAWEGAAALIEDYGQRWRTQHTDACEATHLRREQSTARLELRMRCLVKRRAELGALLHAFEGATVATVAEASASVARLPWPELCRDVRALRGLDSEAGNQADLPSDLEARMREGEALLSANRDRDAQALGGALVQALEKRGPGAALAKALLLRGRATRHLEGAATQAGEEIERALWMAIAHRDDETAALAARILSYTQYGRAQTLDDSLRWLELAEAQLTRLGSRPADEVQLALAAGRMAREHGATARSRRHYQHALDLALRSLGEDHPFTLQARMAEAQARGQDGDTQAALAALDALRPRVTRTLGPKHPYMGYLLNAIAALQHRRGGPDEANTTLRESARILEDALGPTHQATLAVLSNLGSNLCETPAVDEGLALLRRALDGYRRALGPGNVRVAIMHHKLGEASLDAKRPREAEPEFRAALRIFERGGQPKSVRLVRSLSGLARALHQQGDLERAARHSSRAISLVAERPSNDEDRMEVTAAHARLLASLGRDGAECVALARAILEGPPPRDPNAVKDELACLRRVLATRCRGPL